MPRVKEDALPADVLQSPPSASALFKLLKDLHSSPRAFGPRLQLGLHCCLYAYTAVHQMSLGTSRPQSATQRSHEATRGAPTHLEHPDPSLVPQPYVHAAHVVIICSARTFPLMAPHSHCRVRRTQLHNEQSHEWQTRKQPLVARCYPIHNDPPNCLMEVCVPPIGHAQAVMQRVTGEV